MPAERSSSRRPADAPSRPAHVMQHPLSGALHAESRFPGTHRGESRNATARAAESQLCAGEECSRSRAGAQSSWFRGPFGGRRTGTRTSGSSNGSFRTAPRANRVPVARTSRRHHYCSHEAAVGNLANVKNRLKSRASHGTEADSQPSPLRFVPSKNKRGTCEDSPLPAYFACFRTNSTGTGCKRHGGTAPRAL
jgi:hypothetical protein